MRCPCSGDQSRLTDWNHIGDARQGGGEQVLWDQGLCARSNWGASQTCQCRHRRHSPAAATCFLMRSALAMLQTGPRLFSFSVGSPSLYF